MSDFWEKIGNNVEEVVLKVVGDHYGIPGPTLALSTNFDIDLHADFVDFKEIMMTIEELFEVYFDEESIKNINNIGELIDLVKASI